MGFKIADLYADLAVHGLQLTNGQLQQFKKQLEGIEQEAQKAKSVMSDFGGSAMRGFGFLGGVGLAGATAAAIGFALKANMDLEQSVAEIRKTTGLAGKELEGLKTKLLDVSTTIKGLSMKEIFDIGAMGGQLGIKGADKIAGFTKTVGKLAATGDLSATEAADSVAQILNVFQRPIEDAEKLASVITRLSIDTVATNSQIADMTKRMSGAGSVLGMTADQVAALAATMRDAGVNIEVGGSSMSSILMVMAKDSEKFAEALKMPVREFNNLVRRSPIEALKLVIKEIEKMDGMTAIKSLDQLGLDGIRVSGVLLQLSKVVKNLDSNLKSASDEWQKATALNQVFADQTNTTKASLDTLSNSFKRLGASATGTTFLQGLISGATKLADELARGLETATQLKSFDKGDKGQREYENSEIAKGATKALKAGETAKALEAIDKLMNRRKEDIERISQKLAGMLNLNAGGRDIEGPLDFGSGWGPAYKWLFGAFNDDNSAENIKGLQQNLQKLRDDLEALERKKKDLIGEDSPFIDKSAKAIGGAIKGKFEREILAPIEKAKKLADEFGKMTNQAGQAKWQVEHAGMMKVLDAFQKDGFGGGMKALLEGARKEQEKLNKEKEKAAKEQEKHDKERQRFIENNALSLDRMKEAEADKFKFKGARFLTPSEMFRDVQTQALQERKTEQEMIKEIAKHSKPSADSLKAIEKALANKQLVFVN